MRTLVKHYDKRPARRRARLISRHQSLRTSHAVALHNPPKTTKTTFKIKAVRDESDGMVDRVTITNTRLYVITIPASAYKT